GPLDRRPSPSYRVSRQERPDEIHWGSWAWPRDRTRLAFRDSAFDSHSSRCRQAEESPRPPLAVLCVACVRLVPARLQRRPFPTSRQALATGSVSCLKPPIKLLLVTGSTFHFISPSGSFASQNGENRDRMVGISAQNREFVRS